MTYSLDPKPLNEEGRLRALKSLDILDTHPESYFDELVKMAAQICECPYAMITFLDHNRQWFKSRLGIPFPEAPRYGGFCSQAIMEKEFFTVLDASLDPRFNQHPAVTGELNIRFYAAAPIVINGEFNVGVICVSDTKPRSLSPQQIENLKSFSRLLTVLLEGRKSCLEKQIVHQERIELEKQHIHATQMLCLAEKSGVVAHEIKSPLTVMKLALQSLSMMTDVKPGFEDKVKSHLEKLDRSFLRIDKISRSLSSFSRDSREDLPVLNSLENIVDDTITFCLEKLKQRNIKLSFDICNPQLKIECRGVEISQVLLNLINNSADAIEGQSEKWIHLDLRDAGTSVVIIVTDSGVRIPLEVSRHMFKPFFTTKKVNKGTGLGLSICRGIIERHGGKIEFNTLSENTQFMIQLPKVQKDVA